MQNYWSNDKVRVKQKGHTNVDRVLPVFQCLRHYEGIDVRPVLSVLIVLQRFR